MNTKPLTILENPSGDMFGIIPAEVTPELKVLLIFGGTFNCTINNSHYFIAPSTLVILPELSYISEMTTSEDFKGHLISVGVDLLEKLRIRNDIFMNWRKGKDLSICRLEKRDVKTYKLYISLLQSNFQESEKTQIDDEIDILLAKAFCCKVLEKYECSVNETTVSEPDISRKNTLANQFIELAKANAIEHRDLSYYADLLCITPKYLSSVVSKITGKKATKWIEDNIMVQAMQLLKTTDMNISQISDALNFQSPSDFCRCFRKNTGMTPKHFRKQG